MVGSVAGDLPEQVKNNQSVNMAAGNGGQKMSQYSWFTVYSKHLVTCIIDSVKSHILGIVGGNNQKHKNAAYAGGIVSG